MPGRKTKEMPAIRRAFDLAAPVHQIVGKRDFQFLLVMKIGQTGADGCTHGGILVVDHFEVVAVENSLNNLLYG